MTPKIRRLQTIESLFESRENAAGGELARYDRALREATEQLNLLRQHRDNYLSTHPAQRGLSASHLQNHASFMRRLAEAIDQQAQTVQRAQIDCNRVRERYRHARQRTKAVGKVHGKRVAAHRRGQQLREQKELDQWRPRPPDYDA